MNTEHPDLGTMLKSRRQECNLTVLDVANSTHIRRTYLQALEENRFEELPGESYVIGFLRNYATALGLQQSTVLDLYRKQMSDGGSFESAKVPEEQKFSSRPRKKSWGLLPWLGVALLVIGVFALLGLQKALSRPEPLPPREPVAVIDTTPAPPPLPSPAPDAPAGTEPAVTAAPAAEIGAAAITPAQTPTPAAVLPEPTKVTAPTAPVSSPDKEPLVFDFSGNGLVRLESVGANQIQFAGDNRPAQNYELTASAVLNWKVRESARITFVDPTAVKVWIDRRPLHLAGREAIVLQRKEGPAAHD